MQKWCPVLPLIFLMLCSMAPAQVKPQELPEAPHESPHESQAQEQAQVQDMVGASQNVIQDKSGMFHLARWTVSLYAQHDKNGWGPSSRIDYRINSQWGLVASQVKSTVSAGFTVRLGAIR